MTHFELYLALIFLILLCLGGTIYALLRYAGIHHEIVVSTKAPPIKACTIAYRFGQGSYNGCGAIFTDLISICPDFHCIGIYYDDPERVAQTKLRYVVAALLPEDDTKECRMQLLTEYGFKAFELPEVKSAVVAEFPFKSKFSVYLAIRRVYPKIREYLLQHKLKAYPFLEIYEGAQEGSKIKFMGPLEKHEEFYVPECGGVKPHEEKAERKETDKTK